MQMYVYSVYVYYTQELMFSFRIWIQQIFQAFYQIFARTATTENVGEEKSSIFLWKGLKKVRQNRSRILRKDSDHDRLKVKLSATLELPKKHRSEIDSVKYIIGQFLQEEVKVMKWKERKIQPDFIWSILKEARDRVLKISFSTISSLRRNAKHFNFVFSSSVKHISFWFHLYSTPFPSPQLWSWGTRHIPGEFHFWLFWKSYDHCQNYFDPTVNHMISSKTVWISFCKSHDHFQNCLDFFSRNQMITAQKCWPFCKSHDQCQNYLDLFLEII